MGGPFYGRSRLPGECGRDNMTEIADGVVKISLCPKLPCSRLYIPISFLSRLFYNMAFKWFEGIESQSGNNSNLS